MFSLRLLKPAAVVFLLASVSFACTGCHSGGNAPAQTQGTYKPLPAPTEGMSQQQMKEKMMQEMHQLPSASGTANGGGGAH